MTVPGEIGHVHTTADLRVLLHVGVPKTATTAIQTCFASLRHELMGHGVLYPGDGMYHLPALRQLIGAYAHDDSPDPPKSWERIVRQVSQHRGRSMVSGEFAALASPRIAQRIVDDLGGRDVHVVITLRPLEVILPSMWQQDVKDGVAPALTDWLDDVCRGPRPLDGHPPHVFWYVQDHLTVARNWLSAVEPDRLHLVVVDRARPTQVYDAFTRLLGLPPGVLVASRSTRANRSLTLAEAEVLRLVGERLRADGDTAWSDVGMNDIINHMLERRQPGSDEATIAIPARYVEAIRRESRTIVDGLAGLGVDVMGELDALLPTGPVAATEFAEPDSLPMDAAAALLEAMVEAAGTISL